MSKYVFLTGECDPLPIAYKLKRDGHTVIVGLIDEVVKKQPHGIKEKRKWLYDGMIEKEDGEELIKEMAGWTDKDEWFVMFDYGDLWPWAERVMEMGFHKGVFPTEGDYELENDREKGKEFARKNYPGVHVNEAEAFTKVEDAVKFLEENPDTIYVLKAESSNAETVVPMTSNPELAHRQLAGALESEREGYEKDGFTLEEKIRNPIEISPVMVFWDGVPLFSLVELENKGLGAANVGRLTGGCQNLSIRTPLDCRLNQIAFPPIVEQMAKKQPGVSIHDAGLLWDGKRFQFTEFCGMRWGWDGIFSEIAMSGGASGHFEALREGRNPLRYGYGASVRIFQTQPDPEIADTYQDGYAMDWLDDLDEQLYFYCIKKEKEGFESVGYRKDLAVATGASDYMEEAIERAYDAVNGFAMTGAYYRPKFDFLSRDYATSIMNRWRWLAGSGLID